MMKRFGLLGSKRQDFLYARGVRDVAGHLLVGTSANHLFDLAPDGLEIQAHISEHVHGDALAEPDQAEQEMFCADEIVIEAVGFLARQSEGLLSARGEITHRFLGRRRSGQRGAGQNGWRGEKSAKETGWLLGDKLFGDSAHSFNDIQSYRPKLSGAEIR